jgi:hypothetical protein
MIWSEKNRFTGEGTFFLNLFLWSLSTKNNLIKQNLDVWKGFLNGENIGILRNKKTP